MFNKFSDAADVEKNGWGMLGKNALIVIEKN